MSVNGFEAMGIRVKNSSLYFLEPNNVPKLLRQGVRFSLIFLNSVKDKLDLF
jgi:hypothetical protein